MLKPTLISMICLFFVLKITAAARDCTTVRCKAPPEGCTLVQIPGNCCNYVCPSCNLYGEDCVPCTQGGRCVFSEGLCRNRRDRFIGGVIRNPRQCSSSSTCTYNGNQYSAGDKFPSIDNCNSCECGKGGSVSCTEMECVGCEHKGQKYNNGDSFKDSCNSCSCSNGEVMCTEIDCSVDLNPCEYNEQTYQSGDSFKAQDGCNTCTCTNGDVACTEMACEGGCEHKGQHYREGESFKDACNSCSCNSGGVVCTLMACTGCEYKGNYYEEGASFKDDCNTCHCGSDGSVGCTRMFCAHSECEYNGKKYSNGEGFPSSDGCNQCACTEQGVVCTLRACADKE